MDSCGPHRCGHNKWWVHTNLQTRKAQIAPSLTYILQYKLFQLSSVSLSCFIQKCTVLKTETVFCHTRFNLKLHLCVITHGGHVYLPSGCIIGHFSIYRERILCMPASLISHLTNTHKIKATEYHKIDLQ